jgi:hypothetical protein
MSKATKRKHVTREVLDEFVTPEEKQIIVKVKTGYFSIQFQKYTNLSFRITLNLYLSIHDIIHAYPQLPSMPPTLFLDH